MKESIHNNVTDFVTARALEGQLRTQGTQGTYIRERFRRNRNITLSIYTYMHIKIVICLYIYISIYYYLCIYLYYLYIYYIHIYIYIYIYILDRQIDGQIQMQIYISICKHTQTLIRQILYFISHITFEFKNAQQKKFFF